jgi:hypothetical protein
MPTHTNCNDIVDFTFQVGAWFIYVALVAAIAMAIAEAVARSRKPQDGQRGFTITDPAALIGAIKDLLLALGNLPAWFAIFIAGGALIWFARDTISACH